MTALVLVVACTILVSMQCSLYEAVLYSTRRTELEAAVKSDKHPRQAKTLIKMKQTIAGPLASILILNTVANTAGATLAGSLAAGVLGPHWVVSFSVCLTLGILVLSEILPKTVGAVHWRRLWPYIVTPLQAMNMLLFPLVWLSLSFTRWFTGKQKGAVVTEEEILAMVRLGARHGEISDMEGRMVENIIGLENKSARDIMTPRTVMFTLDISLSVAKAYEMAHDKGFNRIPVYSGTVENIQGYVLTNELSGRRAWEHPEESIKSIVKKVSFVPESANCLALLNQFLRRREPLAMVVDEYGGIAGLLTLEDLIETIIGEEIVDETDRVVDLQEQARSRVKAFARKKDHSKT
ncbi:MAG: HlyC/CorC family transporter [Deltaproteobacteria bacterium]|nr:HlyC/CorC family transporter [Deltaproteobacteria bacterium]